MPRPRSRAAVTKSPDRWRPPAQRPYGKVSESRQQGRAACLLLSRTSPVWLWHLRLIPARGTGGGAVPGGSPGPRTRGA